jgi:hypothetical protein
MSQAQWSIPVIPVLRRLRQKNQYFKAKRTTQKDPVSENKTIRKCSAIQPLSIYREHYMVVSFASFETSINFHIIDQTWVSEINFLA